MQNKNIYYTTEKYANLTDEQINNCMVKMRVLDRIFVMLKENLKDQYIKTGRRKILLFNLEEEIDTKSQLEFKKYFDKTIIGQEQAKKIIISSIIMNKLGNSDSKNTCLLVGPTGSGKTLIARTVSKYFNVPMVIVDTTQLTVPGYVGASNDDFIVQLIMKANGDIKKAEEGILVFDEIDKMGNF